MGPPPLGAIEDAAYEERHRRGLSSGGIVVSGTDGVWKTRNPASEIYGKERLCLCIAASAALPAKKLPEAIIRDVETFRGASQSEDDRTMACIRVP